MKQSDHLEVCATLDNLPTVTAFVEAFLEEADFPPKATMQLLVAAEEIYTNIARYAYAGRPAPGKAQVELHLTGPPAQVCLRFTDSGVPYNPLEKPDPDITLAAEQRAIGGLGIFMVKKSVDKLEYSYENGNNILTLTKSAT